MRASASIVHARRIAPVPYRDPYYGCSKAWIIASQRTQNDLEVSNSDEIEQTNGSFKLPKMGAIAKMGRFQIAQKILRKSTA